MAMTWRLTNRYGLNTAVRLHGYTRKGLVTKRPVDKRTFYVQNVWIERGTVFYALLCEEDGEVITRYVQECLSKAA